MCKHCPQDVYIDEYIALFQPCPNPNCEETKQARIEQEADLQRLMQAYGIEKQVHTA